MLSKNAMGNLKNRYKAVLKKCNLLNTFGSLAIAGMLVMGAGVGLASAGNPIGTNQVLTGTYDQSQEYIMNQGTYNISDNVIVTTTKLTMDQATTLTTNNNGTLTVNGWFTESEKGSNISAVDVTIGTNASTGAGLVLGNNLTVGNVTFSSGSHLSLYTVSTDTGVNGHLGDYSAGDKTLTTTSGKNITFANNTFIKNSKLSTSIQGLDIIGDGGLIFNGTTTINSGIISIADTVSFDNSNGIIVIDADGSYANSAVANSANTGLTLYGAKTNAGTINVTEGTLAVASGASLTSTGKIDIASAGILTNAGTIAIAEAANFVNAGAVSISAGMLSIGSADFATAISDAGLTASDYAIFAIDSAFDTTTGGIAVGANANSGTSGAYFGADSLFVVDASSLGSNYAITGPSAGATIYAADGASLLISNVDFTSGDTATVNIASGVLNIAEGAWGNGADDSIASANTNKLYFDSAFVDGTVVYNYDDTAGTATSYSLNLTQVAAEDALPELGPSTDTSLAGLIDLAGDANIPAFIKLASLVTDTAEAAKIIDSSAKMAVGSGVANTANNISGVGVNNVNNRTSLIGSAQSSTLTAQSGVLVASNDNYASDIFVAAVGDAAGLGGMKNGVGVWVQPMYQNTKADGFKSGSYTYGFDSDLYGVSVGADYTMANSIRFGGALHMGSGDSESNGQLSYTENDFDYFGFSLYTGYVRDNFGLSADLGYTVTDNAVKQTSSVGTLNTDDFDAKTFTAGVRAEYKFATSALDIIPHLGMRLTHVDVDSFTSFDSAGTATILNDASDMTTFAIPVGVTFSKDIETANGMQVTPRADLGVQFTMGDLDAEQTVRFPGVNASATMESEVYDAVTFQGGLGIDIAKNNLQFALDYNLGASSNVTNHQVMATFTYKF